MFTMDNHTKSCCNYVPGDAEKMQQRVLEKYKLKLSVAALLIMFALEHLYPWSATVEKFVSEMSTSYWLVLVVEGAEK